ELHFISGPTNALLDPNSPAGGVRTGHAIFFQAPLGSTLLAANGNPQYGPLQNLTNGVGYGVAILTNEQARTPLLKGLPNHSKPSRRYRLMEFRQPTENLRIFSLKLTKSNPATLPQAKIFSWFKGTQPYNVDWSANYSSAGGGYADLSAVPTNRIVAEN